MEIRNVGLSAGFPERRGSQSSVMPACPMCDSTFDSESRKARRLPGGLYLCKTCLLDVANSSADEAPQLALPELPEPPELPDDVLLHLFSFLPCRDLLRGPRGVSRHWRQVALHQSLWKDQSFPQENSYLLSVALKLLPRAHSLSLNLYSVPLRIWFEAAESECAFESLEIDFSYSKESTAIQPAQNILNSQVKRGHLKTLVLQGLPRQYANDLILTALNAGLTMLWICLEKPSPCNNNAYPAPLPEIVHSQLGAASLKHFKYLSWVSDPLAELVVLAHSSTLEKVALSCNAFMGRAIRMLGACPQLREAHLPGVKEIAHLSACPQLTSLTLGDMDDPFTTLPVDYFRGAARRLTRLELNQSDRDDAVDGRVMEALGALATSGDSALRELVLCDVHNVEALRPLPDLLRGLPHLHTLELRDAPPVDTLDAVDPGTAPSLRILRFPPVFEIENVFCWLECPYPALYRLVRRNPLLHVIGVVRYHDCHRLGRDPDSCDCCLGEAHALLPEELVDTEEECEHLCLFAHAPTEECGIRHEHSDTTGGNWDLSACFWVCVDEPSSC